MFSVWEGNVTSEIFKRYGLKKKVLETRFFSLPCKSLIFFSLTPSLICIIIDIYDVGV